VKVVAYLVNRYPEASLTAIRREIDAVTRTGIEVLRFAHRPSIQPLGGDRDRAEAKITEYLVAGNIFGLVRSFLASLLSRPSQVLKAVALTLGLKPLKIRNFSYLLLASRLQERLRAQHAEHLHVHFALGSAVVAMLARALGGPPWSMTVHGPEDLAAENLHLLSVLANRTHATVAISARAAHSVLEAVKPRIARVTVIGMGVDEGFLDEPTPIDPSGQIACVARLEARKGHAILFQAIEKLRDLGHSPRLKLIGDGPLRDQLEAHVKSRGLGRQVEFAGWLPERQVKESLDHCRFLVLPSHSEGLPVSIMESFARARPVIASDVAGIPELVRAHENGLLVPPGDADALAASIRSFLEMPVTRLFELGMHGRSQVMNRFHSARNAQALIPVWRRCRQ
jgi:glycosyltransferase involved in cell wall biosynthesis